MYLSKKIDSNTQRIYIDLMGGSISIKTHSGSDVIVDARKMRYAGLIPQVEIERDTVFIHKQAATSFFPQQEKIILKILIPEKRALEFKMFTGELTVTGDYDSINIKVRTGNVTIQGPYFSINNNSRVNVINGSIYHQQLAEAGFTFSSAKEMETIAVLNKATLYSKVFLGEIPS